MKYYNQSTEIKSLKYYENSHVILDDRLGCKQAKDIDCFSAGGWDGNGNR